MQDEDEQEAQQRAEDDAAWDAAGDVAEEGVTHGVYISPDRARDLSELLREFDVDSIQKMVVLLMDHHVAKAQLQKAERALHDAQAATGTKQIQSTPSKRPA